MFAAALASVSLADVADPKHSAALEQYRKLRCDPRSVTVKSAEPLRFAVVAVCYKLPKSFVHEGWIQLVAVDTEAGTVRLADLGRDTDAGHTLQDDGHGGWRWLARPQPHGDESREILAWALPANEMQARLIGRIELPFSFDRYLNAYASEQCTLVGGTQGSHALLKFTGSGIEAQPVEGVRGVRLWHPGHRAFVVQNDPNSVAVHALLDCDGQIRPLPEPDAARFADFPRQQIVISSQGDWLVRIESPEGDGLVVLQGDQRRSFGPFQWLPKGCPDVGCPLEGHSLFDPNWSPSGELFMTHGFFETEVVSAADLKRVTRWKLDYSSAGDHRVLLSDSLAMELSKKHGVSFRRW